MSAVSDLTTTTVNAMYRVEHEDGSAVTLDELASGLELLQAAGVPANSRISSFNNGVAIYVNVDVPTDRLARFLASLDEPSAPQDGAL